MNTQSNLLKVALLPLVLMATMASVHSQSSTPTPPNLTAISIPARVVEDASAKPKGWLRYQFGARPGFSVLLPSAPGNDAQALGAQVINMYISSTGSAVYAVARVDRIEQNLETASEEARSSYFKGFFQGFAKSFGERTSASPEDSLKLLEVAKVRTAAGRDGFEQRLTYKNWQGRGQMVFVGNSAFCVIALWLPTVPAADYDSFFGSFRIDRVAN